MKLLFMGTSDFAAASLRRVLEEGWEVCAVCTKPDRPSRRGMKNTACPVKLEAEKAGLPLLQPESLRDPAVQEQLRAYDADLFVVVAYGKLLPRAVLDIPPLGCVNVHGSLLPKYRGAAPIQWTVLNGEKEGGVSTMFLDEGMDSGSVIESASLPLEPEESFGSLYARLMDLGADLLQSTLKRLESGDRSSVPQEESLATYAPPITKEMCPVDWSRSPREAAAHICGLDPKPGATAAFGDVVFKVFSPHVLEGRSDLPGGSIVAQGKEGLDIACGGGILRIRELQAPGGKRMAAADYLRGHKLG